MLIYTYEKHILCSYIAKLKIKKLFWVSKHIKNFLNFLKIQIEFKYDIALLSIFADDFSDKISFYTDETLWITVFKRYK